MMDTEKTPLFIVYKQNGSIRAEFKRDCKDYELYGFLKAFLNRFEENVMDQIEPAYESEDLERE